VAGEGKPRRGRVADEEGGDHEVEFVGQARGEELGCQLAAAFEQEPRHASYGQSVQEQS
jgi:hypothetical protein